MALVPGLNIGVGLLLIIIVWVAAVLVSLTLAILPKARYAVPGVLLVTVVVTLILLFYPRESTDISTTQQPQVDGIFFGRLVMLLFLSIFVIGGVASIFAFHLTESITAGQHRTRPQYITS